MDYIIIVAGGQGLRMGLALPKQFALVGGKPVLMRTIEQFHSTDSRLQIIVVLPHDQQDYWRKLCLQFNFSIHHTVVDGGATRYESSQNGLKAIPSTEEGVVGIHDGVRPFVSQSLVTRCYAAARSEGAAIPVLPVTDTLREIDPSGIARNTDRSRYRIVQTPQVFRISLLRKAFLQPWQEAFTDDASVVEHLGHQVAMVEGERENIKLTTPLDLIVADALLKKQSQDTPDTLG